MTGAPQQSSGAVWLSRGHTFNASLIEV